MILRLLRAGLRRVFNLSFLAALSLLLCIGLGCLWERSMRANDWLTYIRSSNQIVTIGTRPRHVAFLLYIPWGVPRNDPTGWDYSPDPRNPEQTDSFLEMMWKDSWLGFKLIRYDRPYEGGGWHVTEITIPLWFPMVLTLVLPLCWLRRRSKLRRQARRVRLGLCLHCGYDLRATPDATGPRVARCPECGRLDNAT